MRLITGVSKQAKRDLNSELYSDGLIEVPRSIDDPEIEQIVESDDDQAVSDSQTALSSDEGSADSDPFGVRTDWPPVDLSSLDSDSLNSFNESLLVKDFSVLAQSSLDSDSQSSLSSFGSSVAREDRFQRSFGPAISVLELMIIPVSISWIKRLFESFQPTYHDRPGIARRSHPRDWTVEIE